MRLRDNLRTLAAQAAVKDPFAAKMEANSPQKHPLADLESRLIDAQVEGTVLDARIKAAEEDLAAKQKEGGASAGQRRRNCCRNRKSPCGT